MTRTGTSDLERELQASTRPSSEVAAELREAGILALTILFHPDGTRVGERSPLPELLSGNPVLLCRREPAFAPPYGGRAPRPLADSRLSRRPIRLTAEPGGGLRIERRESPLGVTVEGAELGDAFVGSRAELERGIVLRLSSCVVLLLHRMEAVATLPPDCGLVGESPALLRVRRDIEKFARLRDPVLLHGETGTGKELAARALHDLSRRGRFIPVNLGAVPATLAAAELFGAAKGAFSDAKQARPGYFQQAAGGTLFLDEIGAATPEIQAMLLRVLETGYVQRVGGGGRHVDVRVLSATDAVLEEEIAAGRFRAPLYHRLSSCEIELPPLRSRREDVGRLFRHFFVEEARQTGEKRWLERELSTSDVRGLARLVDLSARHPWPGNVRELIKIVRLLLASSRGQPGLECGEAEGLLAGGSAESSPGGSTPAGPGPCRAARDAESLSESTLRAALEAHGWDLAATARHFGFSRASLYKRIGKSPDIRIASDLGPEEIENCLSECNGNLDLGAERLEVSLRALKQRMKKLGLR